MPPLLGHLRCSSAVLHHQQCPDLAVKVPSLRMYLFINQLFCQAAFFGVHARLSSGCSYLSCCSWCAGPAGSLDLHISLRFALSIPWRAHCMPIC